MTAPDMPQLESRLKFAVEIAREAGEKTLELFRNLELDFERKADGSPVTAADRGAEELLRRRISERFPDDAVIGEEFGEKSGTSGFRWALDPIDGTKSFLAGVPLYTTLVGVLLGDEPRIGVICAPAAGETVYAAHGLGCWHQIGMAEPRRAAVSAVAEIADAVFVTTSVSSFTTYRDPDARTVYDKLQTACRLTRAWGDGYGYLMVATGRAEVMVDPAMNLWDAAALQPVIEEAGGRFFDWQGRATVHSNEAIATNAALAGAVMAITKAEGGRRKAEQC